MFLYCLIGLFYDTVLLCFRVALVMRDGKQSRAEWVSYNLINSEMNFVYFMLPFTWFTKNIMNIVNNVDYPYNNI